MKFSRSFNWSFSLGSSGRFEKVQRRKTRSQSKVQSLIQEVKKARQEASKTEKEAKELKKELEQEIQDARETRGFCNHILEGAGDQ